MTHCRISASLAISVEAWALWIACLTGLEMNCSEAVFESDCLDLINCFKDPKSPCPWVISAVVDDIKKWAKSRNWAFMWFCRAKSKVEHWLASKCFSRNFVC